MGRRDWGKYNEILIYALEKREGWEVGADWIMDYSAFPRRSLRLLF